MLLGIGEYSATAAESRAQTATRYTVTAVLLADGPEPVSGGRGGTPFDSAPTQATWRTRDGQQRVGEVAAPAGTVAGHAVEIWVDETGAPAERPLTMTAAVLGAPLGAATLWAAAVSLFVFAYRGAVHVLNRRRLAAWGQEWAARQAGSTRRDDQSPTGS
ncbi:hypothetical protein [Amycolatopsis sp. Hca4]|uniref:Rv1733c family protein n=1 Tax=Amycolatopsis sp. Hca4 TaxID=2742131 RepID=UPI00158FF059|nr:hypothetical protein [Amycolatopsis sp. Hca4]QKV80563.1 hypothetical protein HUT10_47380 [Amycolatopsis sp. Hca4]